MKKSPLLRSALAVILAFALVLAAVPLPASAATTSEIKEEIADLKVENAIIQAQIDSIQSQYNANASEISALVAKKDAVDQEIALLHQQILNTNEQLIIYGQLIADAHNVELRVLCSVGVAGLIAVQPRLGVGLAGMGMDDEDLGFTVRQLHL